MEDGATRDVSSCERLILVLRYLHYHHTKGELADRIDIIRWEDIDRLKADCKLLPSEFQAMLEDLESYRS